MKRLELSLFSAEEFLLLNADWQGGGILLESSVLDFAVARDRIREFCRAEMPVIIQDLAAPETARFIPEDSPKLQLEFQSFLLKRCELIAQLGVQEFSLSFHLERAAEDAEFCRSLRRVLGSLWGVLEQYQLRLLLTAHLPAQGAADASWLAQFRQDLLYPNVGFLLELHDADEEVPQELAFYADRLLRRNAVSADLFL
ncbi:MAG: hypothetical protein IJZ19_15430 [Lentisphaeria bacterium]|nr:hypothetical protein [Lentisphaeria bacterium]MBQ9776677.1 hypothetical protein [Lentisphaeria bacterium]